MPRLILTEEARRGILRCRRFLAEKSPLSANRAAAAIGRSLLLLTSTPDIGRPVHERPGRRELLIAFGETGYVALYLHDPKDDAVYVIAFRHQKEAGY